MNKQEEQKCEACDKAFKFNKLSHTLCNDCCNEDELKAFANLPEQTPEWENFKKKYGKGILGNK